MWIYAHVYAQNCDTQNVMFLDAREQARIFIAHLIIYLDASEIDFRLL